MRLPYVPMGSQVGADPEEHPRWDGERIAAYGEPADDSAEFFEGTLADGMEEK